MVYAGPTIPLRGTIAPAAPVRMSIPAATWRSRDARWALTAKARMAPIATNVSAIAVFIVAEPFVNTAAGRSPERGFLAGCGRVRPAWKAQCGGQAGQQDVEAAFEFGGPV